MIKHICFDFSETIVSLKKEKHNQLRYDSYAEIVKKPVTKELIEEYESLYKKFNHSNAAIFHSLGLPAGFWSERVNSVEPKELYQLADTDIPEVLQKIKQKMPIALFSNIRLEKILPAFDINPEWFVYTISAGMVKNPKPALDGFYKIIELSGFPPNEILYIGDDVGKDVIPAKKVDIKAGLMWKKSDEADYCFEKFNDILSII
jgi:FMN phosphatase YigB (HAD superfamily)